MDCSCVDGEDGGAADLELLHSKNTSLRELYMSRDNENPSKRTLQSDCRYMRSGGRYKRLVVAVLINLI